MRDREEHGRFLVLGTARRGEGDLEVEAVTQEDARIRLFLRSAHGGGRTGSKSRSRGSPLAGRLQPLARLDGRWVRGLRGRWRLVDARGEDLRLGVRGDLGRTAALCALGEAAARALPPNAPTDGLFALLDAAGSEISEGTRPETAFRIRLLDLLVLLGHAPETRTCSGCGALLARSARFDRAAGEILCPACAPPVARSISSGVLAFVREVSGAPPASRARFRVTSKTAPELDGFLFDWFERHLEIRLASRALLRAAGYDASR